MDPIHVKEILKDKGSTVWTIDPDATAFHALEIMADKNVGALVVTKDDKLVGIFSERDYARKVTLRGKLSKDIKVSEIMTGQVFVVSSKNTCEECMALFTKRHIRHLPVVEDGVILGLVSIGDVVNKIIAEQKIALTDLENYISGSGYGA